MNFQKKKKNLAANCRHHALTDPIYGQMAIAFPHQPLPIMQFEKFNFVAACHEYDVSFIFSTSILDDEIEFTVPKLKTAFFFSFHFSIQPVPFASQNNCIENQRQPLHGAAC